MGRTQTLALGLLPVMLVFALWQGVASSGNVPASLLPPPGTVFLALFRLLGDQAFLAHLGITLARLLCGFSIALVIGVGLAVLAFASPNFGAVLRPTVRILAPIPKIALYPALILIFGFDSTSKVLLVAADATFPILLATYQGMLSVEPKLVWSARAMGESPARCTFTVVLRAALPSVLTGCRVGLVIACIVVFLAEMISSTDGLGHLLTYAARNFDTVNMFVPLVLISAVGLILNTLFNAVRSRVLAAY